MTTEADLLKLESRLNRTIADAQATLIALRRAVIPVQATIDVLATESFVEDTIADAIDALGRTVEISSQAAANAIQSVVDDLTVGTIVFTGNPTPDIDQDVDVPPIKLRSNLRILIKNGARVRAKAGFYDGDTSTRGIFYTPGAGVRVHNVVIEGEGYESVIGYRVDEGYTGEHRHIIRLQEADDITIRNITLRYAHGDCIYIGHNNGPATLRCCTNVTIDNVWCDTAARNGISVIGVRGLHIPYAKLDTIGVFFLSGGVGPFAGIDFEPDDDSEPLTGIDIGTLEVLSTDGPAVLFELASARGTYDEQVIDARIGKIVSTGGSQCGLKIANTLSGPTGLIAVDQLVATESELAGVIFKDVCDSGVRIDIRGFISGANQDSEDTTEENAAPVVLYKTLASPPAALNTNMGGIRLDLTVLDDPDPKPLVFMQGRDPYVVQNVIGHVRGLGALDETDTGTNDIRLWDVQDSAALSVVGRAGNSAGRTADISAASDGQVLRRSGTALGFGTLATAGIGDDQVTDEKLRESGACSVIGRSANSTGNPADISAASNNSLLVRKSDAVSFASLGSVFAKCIAEVTYTTSTSMSVIAFSAADVYDPAGMHDSASNNSHFVAPETGYYRVTANTWCGSSSADGVTMRLTKNVGATELAFAANPESSGNGNTGGTLIWAGALTAGDYVELAADWVGNGLSAIALMVVERLDA